MISHGGSSLRGGRSSAGERAAGRTPLGTLTLDNRPRWFVLSSVLLAVLTLSFFGNYYHQWLIGVGAALAITAVSNLLYGFVRRRSMMPARPSKNQQAVIVRLSPPRRRGTNASDDDLSTLETELTQVIEQRDVGEYDGNEIGEAGAVLYMYGVNAESLFRAVESTLRSSSHCRGARVHVRPGPPGTPHREIIL